MKVSSFILFACKKQSADGFTGAKHGLHGWIALFIAVALTTIDVFAGICRCVTYFRSGEKFVLKTFWQNAILNKHVTLDGSEGEYANLVQDPEEYEVSRTPLCVASSRLFVRYPKLADKMTPLSGLIAFVDTIADLPKALSLMLNRLSARMTL